MLHRSIRILALVFMAFSGLLVDVVNAAEAGGEYTLSKQYGSVLFKVLYQETLMMVGRFDDYSGTLSLDPANLANAKLTASINMTRFNMSGKKDVSETCPQHLMFDTSVFSSATFTSASVTVTGDNTADFQGDSSSWAANDVEIEVNVKFNRN